MINNAIPYGLTNSSHQKRCLQNKHQLTLIKDKNEQYFLTTFTTQGASLPTGLEEFVSAV